MMRLLLCFFIGLGLCLNADASVRGWHWYNAPHPVHHRHMTPRQFASLSPVAQMRLLQHITHQLRDRAVLSGRVADVTAYKRAQDFWVAHATRFSMAWTLMLLEHPELNYALRFPHQNTTVPLVAARDSRYTQRVLQTLARRNGLLFFYRSARPLDRAMKKTVMAVARARHFALRSADIDTPGIRFKARALGLSVFPVLVLVNPRTRHTRAVAYGYRSQTELTRRLVRIADHWRPGF